MRDNISPGYSLCFCKNHRTAGYQGAPEHTSMMVEQRMALANQLRSLLAEYGFTIPVGILPLQQQLPELIEDASNSLTSLFVGFGC